MEQIKLNCKDFFDKIQECKLIGKAYDLNYDELSFSTTDSLKEKSDGIPRNQFLIAYDEEEPYQEVLILRVMGVATNYFDNERMRIALSMQDLNFDIDNSELEEINRCNYNCKILGTIYEENNELKYGSDVENFYGSVKYKIYKPTKEILSTIINFNCGEEEKDSIIFNIGKVRYSSTRKLQNLDNNMNDVPVYMNMNNIIKKRTGLLGMTRTGKSNTVKIIVEETFKLNEKINSKENKIGQLILDINGEYANKNKQDGSTSILDKYKRDFDGNITAVAYGNKEGQEPLAINFYDDVEFGFDFLKSLILEAGLGDTNYISEFLNLEINKECLSDKSMNDSERTGDLRKLSLYYAILHMAKFEHGDNFSVMVPKNSKIDKELGFLDAAGNYPLDKGNNKKYMVLDPDDVVEYWVKLGSMQDSVIECIDEEGKKYKESTEVNKWFENNKAKPWMQELKVLLTMLTRKEHGNGGSRRGYSVLLPYSKYHSHESRKQFDSSIDNDLRKGMIVIVDLSNFDSEISNVFIEKLCSKIFCNSMESFTSSKDPNPIQIYFEEAHNTFSDKNTDVTTIYSRIAKEGAKLNIGMVYATQEPSAVSKYVKKNTENFFISHLNNSEEIAEISKYYDMADFAKDIKNYSSSNDIGSSKVKIGTNPFTVPVQINKFI